MAKLRIGLPTSLECQPLTRAFVTGQFASRYIATTLPPGRIAPLLADRALDLGVVTPFDLHALDALDRIPDIGVAFVDGSPTLRLVPGGALEAGYPLLADGASPFTVELAKRVLGVAGHTVEGGGDSSGQRSARLLEGGVALAEDSVGVELGRLWRQQTGLPLVVGVWVVQRNVGLEEVVFDVKSSLRYGMAQLQTLARELAAEVGADRRRLELLFRQELQFVLGPEEQKAIAAMIAG